MNFFQQLKAAYLKAVKENYFNLKGRTSRADFWLFTLANFVVCVLLSCVLGLISPRFATILTSLYSIAILLPQLGIGVRRLHDIGKSGWCWLLGLIPVVGWIIVLVFFVKAGQEDANQYGPKVD